MSKGSEASILTYYVTKEPIVRLKCYMVNYGNDYCLEDLLCGLAEVYAMRRHTSLFQILMKYIWPKKLSTEGEIKIFWTNFLKAQFHCQEWEMVRLWKWSKLRLDYPDLTDDKLQKLKQAAAKFNDKLEKQCIAEIVRRELMREGEN